MHPEKEQFKKEYLEYIVTMTNKPLFYIPGNHDNKYLDNPPEGCICIDDDVIEHEGLKILGLGGSIRYSNAKYQYTELQMVVDLDWNNNDKDDFSEYKEKFSLKSGR